MNGKQSRREFLALSGACALGAAATGKARAMDNGSAIADLDTMIDIPASTFVMGTSDAEIDALAAQFGIHRSWFESEAPRRDVHVDAFSIDKYPVTRGQYNAFVQATGHQPLYNWPLEDPSQGDDHPVVGVNFDDVSAYAQWAGKRLPTEAEWEKAARGVNGNIWPWGNAWAPDALNWNPNEARDHTRIGTRPVNAYPTGVSPFGVWDMAGNAAEWVADQYMGTYTRTVKGGGWLLSQPYNHRAAFHNFSMFPNNRIKFIGFRCAQ